MNKATRLVAWALLGAASTLAASVLAAAESVVPNPTVPVTQVQVPLPAVNLIVLPGAGTLAQLTEIRASLGQVLSERKLFTDERRSDPAWPKRLEIRVNHGVSSNAAQIGSIALSGATIGLIPASGSYTTTLEAKARNGAGEPKEYRFSIEVNKVSSMWTLPGKGGLNLDVVKDLGRQLADAIASDAPFTAEPTPPNL